MKPEQYLVFDIETSPVEWETLSESQQEYILRYAETDDEKEQKKFEMGLSPLTAHVVCIGLQLMERNQSGGWELKSCAAFSTAPGYDKDEPEERIMSDGNKCFIYSEKRLMEDFWKILSKYKYAQLISFNGRNFDAPFLMLRSAILRVRPSRNLMAGTKFNYPNHIDLIDELTFYSPSPYAATKRFNFDFYTRVFGITSPKEKGVDGSMVGQLYYAGEVETIAEYCLRDVNATWELFLKWHEYLKF
jgi:DNA polymerase elongation subunit (family B)